MAKDFLDKGISNPIGIGHQILLRSFFLKIIGVTKPWQLNWFLSAEINKGVIIPLEVSYFLSKDIQINNILFR
ncbi:hypothetical protein [Candidatus Coxiella mudrowiae]|uniref:hypothetical protein n=1 Tax=Candidatus Coxiella mudrowiae TaxID=2054173 RepID=UPI0015626A60|nr:hypothetical protein [Candidatus Coxiella mudrowiae]